MNRKQGSELGAPTLLWAMGNDKFKAEDIPGVLGGPGVIQARWPSDPPPWPDVELYLQLPSYIFLQKAWKSGPTVFYLYR